MTKKSIGSTASEEAGGTLLSTLFLSLFLALFISSAALVLKHQSLQFRQAANAYEAKAMIEMTEVFIITAEKKGQSSPREVEFRQGKTTVSPLSGDRYQITAMLYSGYTSRKTVTLYQSLRQESHEEDTGEELGKSDKRPGAVTGAEGSESSEYPVANTIAYTPLSDQEASGSVNPEH